MTNFWSSTSQLKTLDCASRDLLRRRSPLLKKGEKSWKFRVFPAVPGSVSTCCWCLSLAPVPWSDQTSRLRISRPICALLSKRALCSDPAKFLYLMNRSWSGRVPEICAFGLSKALNLAESAKANATTRKQMRRCMIRGQLRMSWDFRSNFRHFRAK